VRSPPVALAVLVGVVTLVYTLISGATILLGVLVAGSLWLYVLFRGLRARGVSRRRAENAVLAGSDALVLLYALTQSNLLAGIGTVALLWIGLSVGRIERHLWTVDAER